MRVILSTLSALAISAPAARAAEFTVTVELEQEVYTYQWPGNGADAFWCSHSPTIVRHGDTVYASGIEVMPTLAPPDNLRWLLFKKSDGKLMRVADGGTTHEREPCPLGIFKDGTLLLTSNPADKNPGTSTANIHSFIPGKPLAEHTTLAPAWIDNFKPNQHTYRSFSVDAANRTFMLFYQNPRISETHWTCYRDGTLVKNGKLGYPRVMYGTRGVVSRICYPAMQIKDGAVHSVGVTDVQEPIDKFRGLTDSWVFRRLYYTWTPDVRSGTFSKWIEIVNHDETDGYVKASDLYMDSPTRARFLWYERELTTRPKVRELIATDKKQRIAVNCTVMDNGKVISTTPVAEWREGDPEDRKPIRMARFHVSESGRLYVLYRVGTEHVIAEIDQDGKRGEPVSIPLKTPLGFYVTPTVRNGSTPSDTIDFLGQEAWAVRAHSVHYARVRIVE